VRPSDKKSYSQANTVWIRRAGLQSDIQKILRHSRKIPEKTQQFYKELNRLRRAAICFGFVELLDTLAGILERECTSLGTHVHPECGIQMSHAVESLRAPASRDPKTTIYPVKTAFNSHD